MYLSNLVLSLQKRKLGELVLADLDNASLNIIKNGLNSQYPAEVYYCLNLLEEVDHPDLSDLIGQLLSNELRSVRMDALQRVQRLMLTDLADLVVARMAIEADADDRYIYVNHLIEEVHVITWLLAAMDDLYGRAFYWTRAWVLYQLGKEKNHHHLSLLR